MMNPILWQPSKQAIEATQIESFRQAQVDAGLDGLDDQAALYDWSIEEPERFWTALWDFAGVRAERRGDTVLEHADNMLAARWFPEARLNFAENLLARARDPGADEAIAIVFRGEGGDTRELSYGELYRQVAALADWLRGTGVGEGDRVAGFLPNLPETIVTMLAVTSIGAIWSSCSPDFGFNGVHDRLGQIEPKILFSADGYRYAGREHDSLAIATRLQSEINSIEQLVVVPYIGAPARSSWPSDVIAFGDTLQQGGLRGEPDATRVEDSSANPVAGASEVNAALPTIDFAQLPFDHPVYILFSSGTTGKPKCIVHGAGGTLLQHLKEHRLHVDVRAGERLFFFTTCGWMMWNWLVSGLASGATLVLYDGSPFHPGGHILFDLVDELSIAHFGTSAKFLDACAKEGLTPRDTHRLGSLRSLLSTGSPLVPESFDYVYRGIASDIQLASMSGGTDIVSCFVLGNPALPIRRGEIQWPGLGLRVEVFDQAGQAVGPGEKGELVCTAPFPCQPTGFFGDPDDERYRAAYFERFDGVWCHGDFITRTESGGFVILGRSDAVLNPGGVRIGTAEIYRQVESIEEILEALVIGQDWDGDVRVVLFVRLRDEVVLDEDLETRIRQRIRSEASPRHVPSRIVSVADIPRTRSGKIVELAVRKVVHGESVDNVEALANPDALELFRDLDELQS